MTSSGSGTSTGLRLTGAIPSQTTQRHKSLSLADTAAEFDQLPEKDWCTFLQT
ncbi:MAG TPA: hypothetical protein VF169_24900 [Albitalea sp.]|uniref:hypothetical protein n=1 Tax=Piscinibacter sp. TaxID=1903157 RepID=UPI002ED3636D